MKKAIFDNEPKLVTLEGYSISICFDVKQVVVPVQNTDDKGEEGEQPTRLAYEAYTVRLLQPIGYDKVVNSIITEAYPQDKMQAIINNHLLDAEDEDEAHEEEYEKMQQWRKKAKAVAKEVMEYYYENLM